MSWSCVNYVIYVWLLYLRVEALFLLWYTLPMCWRVWYCMEYASGRFVSEWKLCYKDWKESLGVEVMCALFVVAENEEWRVSII